MISAMASRFMRGTEESLGPKDMNRAVGCLWANAGLQMWVEREGHDGWLNARKVILDVDAGVGFALEEARRARKPDLGRRRDHMDFC